jgi:tripartite-type tricarboxylate transporter receptor subunit TctC
MFKKLAVIILAGLFLGAVSIQYSYGREYPTKPIEIVVVWGPGTMPDLTSRLAAEIGKKYLKQPLVVVNKSGGSGTVGVSDFIHSKPDGYKIIYLDTPYLVTTIRTQKISFDPNQFLIPLINLAEMRCGLGVRGDSPWRTLDQLLDYARKNPGILRVAIPGRGVTAHICEILIFKKAGAQVNEIPYVKGTAEMLPALLGGHVDAASMIYSTSKGHIDTGKIRLLVTYSDQRYPVTPDIPCAAELGYETISMYGGIYAHKDTPEDIKETLFETFKKIGEDPEFKIGLEKVGDAPKFGGPEFIRESMRKVEKAGIPIIKELGLYVGEPPRAP